MPSSTRCQKRRVRLKMARERAMNVTTPQTPIESGEVLDLLAGLVQKSLVVYEEDAQGRGRYRLLETVRLFAQDRLLETGEAGVVRTQHRNWFLDLAEESRPEGRLDRLEREHDN